ncbi:ATP-dependent RNA helicase HrpA [Salinibacterium sp. SYSU T00001]|uniref:ATP-dependent RNA helicase HrpA n=1 Tax=Homoserinimonas sedimenticola TaxID=2986805 RepID=UPI00223556E1|nr:ATP-dependent RNA helicase HrpA [Salinibacterium sedimenticola]MCW4386367.1 ATP-dependent RNA helicase HrpA [Salinibacterium sedimenticola]
MIPAIAYPPDLPVSGRRDDIMAAIRDHQVVIVAGATGSGKTTQLPKMLLELGYESIGHTQPRRIAARTIAERIAEELGQEVGGLVGYQVRFTDRTAKGTRIKLMTDGILLNEIHRDRMLRKYDAIIIDEAHERSLTIDFLLGYLKQLLPKRPDLKVIITSATIDPERFAAHFASPAGPAPIVEVSGRTYPVEIRYRPLAPDATTDDVDDDDVPASAVGEPIDLFDGINSAIDELGREGSGDILVFLSGENEIRDAEDAIRARNLPGVEVLPLYGRLSAADQHRVFQRTSTPGIRRRIVLATNVAETSLTVPGIKYVIDAGTARISRYSARAKIQRLPIEPISQASANQRSGRSGRTSEGIAIRLYSQEDFEKRPEFTDPEILRTNLAAVILQMISLGLGAIEKFPFLQPPDSRGIKDGLDLLRELGAVSTGGAGGGATGGKQEITKIGRQLSQLPIDPRLARMVIESKRHGVTREVMAIVAGLSIQDPRERPLDKRPQADQLHARFVDKTSDFLTLLNLWNYLKEQEQALSGNQFRRLCKAEYLNYLRVREWADVYRQLERMAKPLGLTIGDPSTDGSGIHRSLMAGLLSQLGIRDDTVAPQGKASKDRDRPRNKKGDYLGARQVRFSVFPGSALAKKPPAEIMSAELVETSRLFARMNAAVDLAWAEPLAGDLVKRQYGEPHWEKRQGAAVAYERVTLYGVPIVARRRVQLSRIDPALARELFIRHALVEGEWDVTRLDKRLTAFDRANRALRRQLAEVEERTRRRDILLDDEAVFEFYDRRLPADVATQRDFEAWWKRSRPESPELLTMTREDLIDEPDAAPELLEADYPKWWRQGDQRLKVTYRFEPGAKDDGVTVHVPLALLARLSPAGFDWQVPGLRADLVAALIKALPKAIRRNVVPAGDWARKLLEGLPDDLDTTEMPLTEYIAREIQRRTYTPVDVEDFELDRVPEHLLVTFAVVNEHGRELARSKDLTALQAKLRERARESVARAHARPAAAKPGSPTSSASPQPSIERGGLTAWDFDELPRIRDTRVAGNVVRGYPALVDEGASVGIRLMSTPAEQLREHRRGVRRMLQLAIPAPTAYVQEHLTAAEKLSLGASPYPSTRALFDDAMAATLDDVLGFPTDAAALPWTRADFEALRDRASARIVDGLFTTVSLAARSLAAARDAERAIKAATSMALIAPLADARSQLEALVHPGFIGIAGVERLHRVPLYLAGITHRVERLAENLGRDRVWMSEVQSATELYTKAGGALPLTRELVDDPELAHLVRVRWMLEELRISLFAQHLGTSGPVSVQRIQKALAAR